MPTRTDVFPRQVFPNTGACKWFFGCVQKDGDIRNSMTGKSPGKKQVGFLDSVCWGTSGYATIGGGSQNYATIDNTTSDLESLATHILVTTWRLKKAAVTLPAAEGMFFASYQPGQAPYGGTIWSMLTTGAVRQYINTTDNITFNHATPAGALTNGTVANEIVVVSVLDGLKAYMAVNGVEASVATPTLTDKSIASGRNARLGLSLPGTNQPDSVLVQAFGVYCVDKSRGNVNRSVLYDWVSRYPERPLPPFIFGY